MNQLYAISSGAVRGLYDRWLHTPPILDRQRYFPEHALFEEHWGEIRSECLALMQEMERVPEFHQLMKEQADLSQYGNKYWRMCVLRAYGVDNKANQARCPATAALLKGRPQILSATLSFLEGRKRIPAHRGPFRGILRFHLGVVIPKDSDGRSASGLMIDGRTYPLEEGKTLLWDDTYEHAAWNDADSIRACLLLDVVRPAMPWPLAAFNWLVLKLIALAILLRGQRGWSVATN